jgi:hypothetical protein
MGKFASSCALASLYAACCLATANAQTPTGEYDASLENLRAHYRAPASADGNHFFDLWGGTRLHDGLLANQLTNNRALIILSHGKGIWHNSRLRYAYYPDARACCTRKVPYYSTADFAEIIGPIAAAEIHNVVVAGCNVENAFDAAEIRRYFVNATNVTHTPGGKNGFELVFRHSLLQPSSAIRLLYSSDTAQLSAGFEDVDPAPAVRKVGFTPYVALLYRPGATAPYAQRIAGRELLDYHLTSAAPGNVTELREAALQIVAAAKNARSCSPAGENAGLFKDQTRPSGIIRWAP